MIKTPNQHNSSNSTEPANAPASNWPDLTDPRLYLNRELTWLTFNRRVLHEAKNPRTPLLERVKFIAIVSSNLDEFFMKRMGGLKQQIGAGYTKLTVDGRTPAQQIEDCAAEVRLILQEVAHAFADIMSELEQHRVQILSYQDLTATEKLRIRADYQRDLLPLVTPLGLDSSHPFPFISNLSLNLLVTLSEANGKRFSTRVKVPIGQDSPRFIRVGTGHRYIPLEEVVTHNLHLIFPDCGIESFELFRVTRNASTERNEERAEDLLAMIEEELRNRKFAPTVRLEITQSMSAAQRAMLIRELGVDTNTDVYETDGLLGKADLMEFLAMNLPKLLDPPHLPANNSNLSPETNIFDQIRQRQSILLQYPKESFATSVERFVFEASIDPQVLAIKATLYRTSATTGIVSSLAQAAANGKHVAVIVELKARFDEAANVGWARRLEEAGVHVSYGVVGLKTHCKALLVIRREQQILRRYVHIGTGNYHAGTAKLYVDFGLMSCDENLGHDIVDLFNCLTTGRNVERPYRKILTAPKRMKKALLKKIDREITLHNSENPGHIRLKTNALEDADVVRALYRAGRAGVTVELLVRDTCRLRPGLPGLSETITVTSTVSRFLEHCRIYYFQNGGDEEYFIGSADLMQRNLEHRVELLVPVEPPRLRADLRRFLDAQLNDVDQLWTMQPDGSYARGQSVVSAATTSAPPAEKQVASQLPSDKKTILVIEADRDLRVSIAELLEAMGYLTLRCRSAEEAMNRYVSNNTQIDLFLVAAFLPDMNGVQFVHAAQRLRSKSRALVFSSSAMEEGLRQQLRDMDVSFIGLPFSKQAFEDRLTNALNQENAAFQGSSYKEVPK